MSKNYNEIINLIVKEDSRYDKNAYHFMRQVLDFTLQRILEKNKDRDSKHISGIELCHGLKDYALQQYGPMAYTLLSEWGIHSTENIGDIVFNLVEYEVFGKTDDDNPNDFISVFDFKEIFQDPFEPKNNILFSNRKKKTSSRL